MFCDGLRFSIDLAYSRRSAVEEMAGKKRSEVGWSWPFFLHSPLSESLERVNLYSNRMTWENKRIHTPSLTSWGVLFSIGSSNRGTTLHGGDGGAKLKLYFLLLKSVKRKKTQFWANCLNSFCRRLYILYFFCLEMHLSHLSLLENNRGLWGKNRPCFRVKQESINLGY